MLSDRHPARGPGRGGRLSSRFVVEGEGLPTLAPPTCSPSLSGESVRDLLQVTGPLE